MTGYRLHELVLAVVGFALLATVLSVRSCRTTERLRVERLERAEFAQQVRLAYADGDPVRAARDPRDRLTGVEVAPGGGGPGGGGEVLINVNTADEELLSHLPGIGATRARDILAARERLGGFRAVDDLLDVHGIGEKTLERLRPMITVGGTGPATGAPATGTPAIASRETPSQAARPPDGASLRPGVAREVADAGRAPAALPPSIPPAAAPPAPPPPPLPTPLVVAPPSSTPPAPAPHVAPAAASVAAPAANGRVNINTAGLEELMSLVGIGKVKAEEIIRHRGAYGPFAAPADIMNVKGIGEKTFEKNRHRIVVR